MTECIHVMSQYQLAVGSQVKTAQGYHLPDPYGKFIQNLIDLDNKKLELYRQLKGVCTTAMQQITSMDANGLMQATQTMANMRAQLEFVDQTVFKVTPGIVMMLLDMNRPISKDAVDHLIITKYEKTNLINRIKAEFGDELAQDTQPWLVSSVLVIKDFLEKNGHKTADEPWG